MGRTACTEPQCLYKGALDFTVNETPKDSDVPTQFSHTNTHKEVPRPYLTSSGFAATISLSQSECPNKYSTFVARVRHDSRRFDAEKYNTKLSKILYSKPTEHVMQCGLQCTLVIQLILRVMTAVITTIVG